MGDTIKITVTNNLGNQSTAVHFHGLFQTNTTFSDGPAMVTQVSVRAAAFSLISRVSGAAGMQS
jgi:iron transport multicopper oxidase